MHIANALAKGETSFLVPWVTLVLPRMLGLG